MRGAGEDDVGCTPEMAQWLGQRLPGARVRLVAKAGHMLYFDEAGVWGEVVQWLRHGCTTGTGDGPLGTG